MGTLVNQAKRSGLRKHYNKKSKQLHVRTFASKLRYDIAWTSRRTWSIHADIQHKHLKIRENIETQRRHQSFSVNLDILCGRCRCSHSTVSISATSFGSVPRYRTVRFGSITGTGGTLKLV